MDKDLRQLTRMVDVALLDAYLIIAHHPVADAANSGGVPLKYYLSLYNLAGINAFPVIVLGIFLPLVLSPWILSKTLYRDTKPKTLEELPRFTPTTPALPTLFGAAREGAELLFLLLIPAAAVIFAIIGALDYIGLWKPFEQALSAGLTLLSIDPKTGILSVLASPTLARPYRITTIYLKVICKLERILFSKFNAYIAHLKLPNSFRSGGTIFPG